MKRNAKTPLLRLLGSAFRSSLIDEPVAKPATFDSEIKRRDFLKVALGTAGLAALSGVTSVEVLAAGAAPRIAIVGGGLAGLTVAHYLKRAGYRATIYEASSGNAWGRIQTRHASNGLTAELGGEFIDSNHADMLRLAREFRLPLIDIAANVRRGRLSGDTFYFNGQEYSEAEVIRAFRSVNGRFSINGRIAADAASLPDEITYRTQPLTPVLTTLDRISIDEYLTRHLHLTNADLIYRLLTAAYTSEFGLATGDQSALNLLTMIDSDVRSGFKVFGDSDERFKIRGGNARLIEAMTRRLTSQIETGRKLQAIRPQGSGFALHFDAGREITADFLILALPFSTLRGVDLIALDLTPKKRLAITDLGYGTNAKLLLDVRSRVWRKQHRSGYLFNEAVQNGWDNSLGQNGDRGAGSYTVFIGGESGEELGRDRGYDAVRSGHDNRSDTTAPSPHAQSPYAEALNRAFSGFGNAVTASQAINWTDNPLSRGSYAAYRPGQWTTLAGVEAEPAGNIFFCGEHCSLDFQGFMNGAAQTGREAATELIRLLKRN